MQIEFIDGIADADARNLEECMKVLKDDLFILNDLFESYKELRAAFPSRELLTLEGFLKHLLISECIQNYGLGALTMLRGHLNDSRMYARRASEAMRIEASSVFCPLES